MNLYSDRRGEVARTLFSVFPHPRIWIPPFKQFPAEACKKRSSERAGAMMRRPTKKKTPELFICRLPGNSWRGGKEKSAWPRNEPLTDKLAKAAVYCSVTPGKNHHEDLPVGAISRRNAMGCVFE